jgi:hypothetical protein
MINKKMPALKKILLLVICLSFSAFVFHKSYLINPGENVGPFYVWKITVAQLKSQLGPGILSTKTWSSQYNNEVNTYTLISYPDKGLEFTFYSEAKSQKDYFGKIEVKEKCDASTDKGLSVGSTRADVNRIYANYYSMGNTIKHLVFSPAGITFNFENCSIPKPTDTVTSICIYKPRIEMINFAPK